MAALPWYAGGHFCFIVKYCSKDILLKRQRPTFDPGGQKAVKATTNKFSVSPSTARIWLLPALNISLFRIVPLFSGYSCILIGSVKAILKQCQLTCQQCYQVSTNFTFVLFLQLTKEGTSLSMLLCSLFGCARQIMA